MILLGLGLTVVVGLLESQIAPIITLPDALAVALVFALGYAAGTLLQERSELARAPADQRRSRRDRGRDAWRAGERRRAGGGRRAARHRVAPADPQRRAGQRDTAAGAGLRRARHDRRAGVERVADVPQQHDLISS